MIKSKQHCDVLIIGSGISGLSYALHLLNNKKDINITIITKSDEDETNTKYAQGGLAVVLDGTIESNDKHIQDTLIVGAGMCNPKIVELVINEAKQRFDELVNWGVQFDKNKKGEYDLHLEGGHTEKRIVHHKDTTGKEIERALLEFLYALPTQVNFLNYHYAIDIFTNEDNKNVRGAYVYDSKKKEIHIIEANIILLATGGIGQVYHNTTNPYIATGDGIALAHRLEITTENMAFIQFHPTVLYEENVEQSFLLTEALRGRGARLLNIKKEPFMTQYHPMGDLAPRDIVARAIIAEMKKHHSNFVFLSMTHLSKDTLMSHFPTIYSVLKNKHFLLEKDLIPIVPASHYLCGGIKVNEYGQTEIKNLYAVGECACTGLHGANRLASNSLLEAVVFSYRAAEMTLKNLNLYKTNKEKIKTNWIENKMIATTKQIKELNLLKQQLKKLMSNYLNILRNNKELLTAKTEIKQIEQKAVLYQNIIAESYFEFKNMLCIAKLITEDSIQQQYNRGTFFNEDLKHL